MTHWNVAQPPRRLRASLGWEWAQHAAPLQVCRRSPLSEVTPGWAGPLDAAAGLNYISSGKEESRQPP